MCSEFEVRGERNTVLLDVKPAAIGAFSVVLVVVLLAGLVFGLVTCLTSYHWRIGGTNAADTPATNPPNAAYSATTASMLSVVSAGAAAGMGGMDRLRGGRTARELAATRDRQVRLHAVHTDIAINLPHSIAMPDGEEHPFTSSRLHIRDSEQESEIYQKCIRPPPNRTVLETESPPPYRSNSAGMLPSSSSSSSGSDWSSSSGPLVVRCHSMSSTSKTTNSNHPSSAASSAAGQKTDFLQRTVKIFTGGKKTTTNQPSPAPTLPVVIVPATSRTQRAAPSRSKPPPGV
ncbi:uncharacterized protein isoform X2 [Leptinotarsa decemlineata]|uniref:uncharacterized protein isoform X2 n=1 Tax=Leptinotarsa decemlineata TaxID=7539 RepID=UPI003D304C13